MNIKQNKMPDFTNSKIEPQLDTTYEWSVWKRVQNIQYYSMAKYVLINN